MPKVTYEMKLEQFREMLSAIREEDKAEFDKILRAVVPIWINTATKYTVPDIGSKKIDSIRYYDGDVCTLNEKGKTYGRRRIYDLLQSVRDGKGSSIAGQMLRKGYYYLVFPRKGKPKYCRTLEEAERYAHISYRGLYRAAWGLSAAQVSGKISGSTKSLIKERPDLTKQSGLNSVTYDPASLTVLITNQVIPDNVAEIAVRNADKHTTDVLMKRMEKYFAKDVPF